ncbi:MAG: ATP-binding protein [Candidatus Symbiobacter sp.]|nr:ATP-binding protein [Candidatus Symbiobacter sp.]
MLISVTLENWMSFNEPVTFSMVAGEKRRLLSRVPKLKKQKMRVLPIAAIFGANASGKSNFFKAIEFAEHFITNNPRTQKASIPVSHYKLDEANLKKPSCLDFELLIKGELYHYGFAATKTKVFQEKLTILSPSGSEKLLFARNEDKIEFGASIKKKIDLEVIFRGTQPNQLFLQNSVAQNLEEFKSVYDWFNNQLITINPDHGFGMLIDHEKINSLDSVNDLLSTLDFNFNLNMEDIEITSLPMFNEIKDRFFSDLEENKPVPYPFTGRSEYVTIQRIKDQFIAQRAISQHLNTKGEKINFQISEESDGSQRIMELLPAFMMLMSEKSEKTIIIDEFDRSLHTLLTRELLEQYLEHCSESSRSQIIFTTHDVMLMSRDYLRDDEMWIVNKQPPGETYMYRLQDFKDIKENEDVRHTYLSGRLDGVPRLLHAYF